MTEHEKQPVDESESGNSQTENRAKPSKSVVFKLNIIFGIVAIASIAGGIILQNRESSGTNILGDVLVITFALGLIGIFLTNAINKVIQVFTGVKSAVKDLKNHLIP